MVNTKSTEDKWSAIKCSNSNLEKNVNAKTVENRYSFYKASAVLPEIWLCYFSDKTNLDRRIRVMKSRHLNLGILNFHLIVLPKRLLCYSPEAEMSSKP